jgi:hypothetical protein
MKSFIICTHYRILIRTIKSRRMRMAQHIVRNVKMKNSYKILVRKSDRRRDHIENRLGWEDNVRMYLKPTGCKDADWIRLAQYRGSDGLLRTSTEPSGSTKRGGDFLTS